MSYTELILFETTPYTPATKQMPKLTNGTNDDAKGEGNKLPVALSSTAWGTATNNSIATTYTMKTANDYAPCCLLPCPKPMTTIRAKPTKELPLYLHTHL